MEKSFCQAGCHTWIFPAGIRRRIFLPHHIFPFCRFQYLQVTIGKRSGLSTWKYQLGLLFRPKNFQSPKKSSFQPEWCSLSIQPGQRQCSKRLHVLMVLVMHCCNLTQSSTWTDSTSAYGNYATIELEYMAVQYAISKAFSKSLCICSKTSASCAYVKYCWTIVFT